MSAAGDWWDKRVREGPVGQVKWGVPFVLANVLLTANRLSRSDGVLWWFNVIVLVILSAMAAVLVSMWIHMRRLGRTRPDDGQR